MCKRIYVSKSRARVCHVHFGAPNILLRYILAALRTPECKIDSNANVNATTPPRIVTESINHSNTFFSVSTCEIAIGEIAKANLTYAPLFDIACVAPLEKSLSSLSKYDALSCCEDEGEILNLFEENVYSFNVNVAAFNGTIERVTTCMWCSWMVFLCCEPKIFSPSAKPFSVANLPPPSLDAKDHALRNFFGTYERFFDVVGT